MRLGLCVLRTRAKDLCSIQRPGWPTPFAGRACPSLLCPYGAQQGGASRCTATHTFGVKGQEEAQDIVTVRT